MYAAINPQLHATQGGQTAWLRLEGVRRAELATSEKKGTVEGGRGGCGWRSTTTAACSGFYRSIRLLRRARPARTVAPKAKRSDHLSPSKASAPLLPAGLFLYRLAPVNRLGIVTKRRTKLWAWGSPAGTMERACFLLVHRRQGDPLHGVASRCGRPMPRATTAGQGRRHR